MSSWQFWIDRGGTFTDVVARPPHGAEIVKKLLSVNPERYEDAALEAIRQILVEHGGSFSDIGAVKLGTTVVPANLLELPDRNAALNGVIRAQIPTAIPLLLANIILMRLLAFPA